MWSLRAAHLQGAEMNIGPEMLGSLERLREACNLLKAIHIRGIRNANEKLGTRGDSREAHLVLAPDVSPRDGRPHPE